MSSIWSKLINLAANVTGILPVANGGTGLASGTDGGVVSYTATGTIASSGLLTNHAVVVGGGAGATPKVISAGTNGQLLVGVTSADPAFGSTVSAATTFSGGVVFNGGGTNLNNYTEATATVNWNGGAFTGGSAQSVTAVIRKIGKVVTVELPLVGATTNATSAEMTTSAAPLAAYVPAASMFWPLVTSIAGGALQLGWLTINTGGDLAVEFYPNATTTVASGSTTVGYRRISVTYTTAA